MYIFGNDKVETHIRLIGIAEFGNYTSRPSDYSLKFDFVFVLEVCGGLYDVSQYTFGKFKVLFSESNRINNCSNINIYYSTKYLRQSC